MRVIAANWSLLTGTAAAIVLGLALALRAAGALRALIALPGKRRPSFARRVMDDRNDLLRELMAVFDELPRRCATRSTTAAEPSTRRARHAVPRHGPARARR